MRHNTQVFCQIDSQSHAGKVVVAEGWVADMTRDEDLFRTFSLEKKLTIGQISILKSGIDKHLIFTVFQVQELIVTHAESPILLVVGSPVRNPLGMFRIAVRMFL
jgi:hypothetical protein